MYSSELKAVVVAMYRSGRYSSYDKIQDYLRKTIKGRIPCVRKIGEWCGVEQKAAEEQGILEKAQEEVADEVLKMFKAQGMPEEDVIKEIVGLITGDNNHFKAQGIHLFMEYAGKKRRSVDIKSDGKAISMTKETIFVLPANGFEPT